MISPQLQFDPCSLIHLPAWTGVSERSSLSRVTRQSMCSLIELLPCFSCYCPDYVLRFGTRCWTVTMGQYGRATSAIRAAMKRLTSRRWKPTQSHKFQLPKSNFNSLADTWTFYSHCSSRKGSWPVIWSLKILLLSRGAELFSLADRDH